MGNTQDKGKNSAPNKGLNLPLPDVGKELGKALDGLGDLLGGGYN